MQTRTRVGDSVRYFSMFRHLQACVLVVTLVVTNPEAISISGYWAPAFEASGIVPYAYVPPSDIQGGSNWPALGSMIDSGKRLVTFMDYNSNTTAAPYILPEFDHM
jgi:hypothetical protein